MPMRRGESEEERGERVSRPALAASRVSLLTEDSGAYSGRGQFVGTDRALSQQLRLRSAEVEDGAGLGEGGGSGVDEEGDAAVELVEDGGGCRAWGDAAAVGAGGGEGADAAGEGTQKGMRGQAYADGVAAGGEGGGQVAACGQYEGEGAGPVAFDEALGRGVAGRAYYCACLLCVTEQDGQRLVWSGRSLTANS